MRVFGTEVAREVAGEIRERGARRVAVDGVDGVGKTAFALTLGASLGTPWTVVHADDHLNPPEVRHARGRESPEGFWLDSYDQVSLRAAAGRDFVVVEGLFLHRDELVGLWDLSLWLDAPFDVTVARMAERDGTEPDPEHPSNRRYVGGQRLYLAACRPWERASAVVDFADMETSTVAWRD